MSILDHVYSPTAGYVGKKIRDLAPTHTGREPDQKKQIHPMVRHMFEDSIGGDKKRI